MSAARPPAFDDLLAPLVGRGYALAVTMLNDPMSAEDAVQEAAIKAWRKLPALHWFATIERNQGAMAERQRRAASSRRSGRAGNCQRGGSYTPAARRLPS